MELKEEDMGCIVCNLATELPSSDEEHRKQFFEELANDIATNHPEIVTRINEIVRTTKQPPLSLERIALAVTGEFQISIFMLRGSDKHAAFLIPRQIFIYITRQYTNNTLNAIGQYLDRRAPGTVSHDYTAAIRRMQHPDIQQNVNAIKEALGLGK